MDDLTFGAKDTSDAFQLCAKSKEILAEGRFNLWKFMTNSPELQQIIDTNEEKAQPAGKVHLENCSTVKSDDQTFTKDVLGQGQEFHDGELKVLGVKWNIGNDQLFFDMRETMSAINHLQPTKRQIIGATAKFYDPLVFLSALTIHFKVLFQDLCARKIDWDEVLSGELLAKWKTLVSQFEGVIISIPRYYFDSTSIAPCIGSLHGFCDASATAFAAVIHLKFKCREEYHMEFLVSKTRVAPLSL